VHELRDGSPELWLMAMIVSMHGDRHEVFQLFRVVLVSNDRCARMRLPRTGRDTETNMLDQKSEMHIISWGNAPQKGTV
jgi:hypothetical protein